MYTCAYKINDVEALIQNTGPCTRYMHDNLHEHACQLCAHPDLVCMHVDVYINCKPRMMF